MNLSKLSKSRSRLFTKMEESNYMPLHSKISVFTNNNSERSNSLTDIINAHRESRMSYQFDFSLNKEDEIRRKMKKSVLYPGIPGLHINYYHILQMITQQTADQLAIIIGKMDYKKTRLLDYCPPEERFNKKVEYTMQVDVPLKTEEEKMLKIQHMIKEKINEVIVFLHKILKETGEEMRESNTFRTLAYAIDNINRSIYDDFTVLDMRYDKVCAQLFRDVKRVGKKVDGFMEENRAIAFGALRAKDRLFFLNMKEKEYIEKWEQSRQWLNKYACKKKRDNITNYINDINDQIEKDIRASQQITYFMEFDIGELEQRRDEYPDKLDVESDMRNRVINQLKDKLEIMKVQKKMLADTIAIRKVEIEDWKMYKELKEIQDTELQRLADEEEAARLLEEERIAAEIAAEEEFLATLSSKQRLIYLQNKKKEKKKAAKAAKAAKKAEKKKRSKA